ncbi:uncharacterized protein [Miscanthus floridulus]|uniref:uncharacterized protein n=1 Tax=Miscanthus floridulus TaxID=154761 RepID=UPI0034593B43
MPQPGQKRDGTDSVSMSSSDPLPSPDPARLPSSASPDPRPPLIPTAPPRLASKKRNPIPRREDQTLSLIGRFVIGFNMSGDMAVQAGGEAQQQQPQQAVGGNRIQVSSSKKPLFFYVNLAKRYMQQHGDVELSALGLAISTVVTIAEILKNNGLAVEKRIRTSTLEIIDETKARPIQKAKIEIVLGKTDKFDELMVANAGDANAGDGEEQT